MIRILHVVGSLELGGTEAFIMNIYRNIDRSKIQFDFLVLGKKNGIHEHEIKELGGNVFYGQYPTYKKMYVFIKETIIFLKTHQYLTIHSHLNIANSWILVAALFANVPIRISHSHDTYGKNGSLLLKLIHVFETWIIKLSGTIFLACSKEAGIYLYGKLFFDKFGKVINNGIDISKFLYCDINQNQKKKELNIPEDCELILTNVTRFENKKNQLFLIDIFNEILKLRNNSILLLGGVDGGLLDECKRKVSNLGIDKKVLFIGPRTDVPEILNITDIYLFPSLYEGLGIVLLEAQAAKCFCVASTACPKVSDMELGLIEYISLNNSVDYWATHILKCFDSLNLDNLSKEKIMNKFEEKNYSISALSKQMTKIYGDCFLHEKK